MDYRLALLAASLSGCALVRPVSNPVDRAALQLRGCVRTQLTLARYPVAVSCAPEAQAYCAALGLGVGCREGWEEYRYLRNALGGPPNVNHVGG